MENPTKVLKKEKEECGQPKVMLEGQDIQSASRVKLRQGKRKKKERKIY